MIRKRKIIRLNCHKTSLNKIGKHKTVWVLLLSLFCASSNLALASNTSGVHGPNVNPNDRSAQLRIALSPGDEDRQEDAWAYRFHYQHAFSDRLRGRVITQFRDRGDFQYDYLRAEMLYNFKKAEDGIWSSGVRFDIRTRRGSRPEEYAVHWTNQ